MSGTADTESDPLWPRLAALFEQLMDLPVEDQGSHLEVLALESPLLAQRLRVLLLAHARSDPKLARGAAFSAFELDEPPLEVGDRVGPWQLLRRLGEGGMGEVWRAERHEGELRYEVALKRIRGGAQLPELKARFLRERGILARLTHPHIARFIDAGIDAQGSPWLAMEFVDGENLLSYCEQRQLSPRARIQLSLQVLAALDHAHRMLVVHRDLKPGNVLVDRDGEVKLLDFGIAKLLESAPELTATRAHAPLTPRYAAPEQLAGDAVGTAADVYSAGVLLFELLSGRSPFGDEVGSSTRRSPDSLWQAWSRSASAGSTAAAYTLDPRLLRRQLRGELQLILSRALAAAPEDRYPSAAAFADDLQAWLDERPLRSRPTPWPNRLYKLIRRHRLASASLALALFAVVGGLVVSLHQAQQAEQRAAQAEAARAFLGEVFSAADPQLHGDTPPSLNELLQRGAERLQSNDRLDPRTRVLLQQDLGRVSLSLDQRSQAAALLAQAEAAAAQAGLDAQEQRSLQLDLAELALAQDQAESGWQRLHALPLPSTQHAPSAQDLRELGLRSQLLQARSQPAEALALLEPYLQAATWQIEPVGTGLLAHAASVQMQLGRPRDALASVERALPLLTVDSPLGLRVRLFETEVEALRSLVDTPRALARQREVIDLLEQRLGSAHTRTLWARMMLCGLLIGDGALAQADAEYSAVWPELQGEERTGSMRAEALWGWGMVAFRRGEFAPARQRFEQAHALYVQAFGADSGKARQVAEALAMVRVETDDIDAGLAELQTLVAAARAVDDRARLGSLLNSQALALLAAERPAQALPLIEQSLALSAELGQASWWTQVIHARALRLAGDPEAAVAVAEPVVAHYRDVLSPKGGPRRAEAERELALALQQGGPEARARAANLLESALAQRRSALGDDSPLTRQSGIELAQARAYSPR
ncbi:protein kinase [Aquimonas sp.]|jgi:serine/threonine-protein kinase|uniref:serine/threonine-protein kinase n=1 Tax=Aquimonas sp. TaxID=1872588 RepID=UPI0037BFAC3F